jgi:hypothetical protein
VEQAYLPSADSLIAGGSVTSPGAAGVIATITPPAGKYRVLIRYNITGTAETQLNNLSLNANAANLTGTLPTITGSGWHEVEVFLTLDGINPVRVRASAAATTGAVYSASLAISKLN